MIFFGYGIVTANGERESDLTFTTLEAAEGYLSRRDTYFFKSNARVVELYFNLPSSPLQLELTEAVPPS